MTVGLGISPGCWTGAYSAFMRWRIGIAKAAGIPLLLMEGFYEAPKDDLVSRTQPREVAFSRDAEGGFVATRDSLVLAMADAAERGDAGRWEQWSAQWRDGLPLKWNLLKRDPLYVLLSHSDCDGKIAAKHCLPIAKRLEELLPLLPDEDAGGHLGVWREKTQAFIVGLRLAASKKEDIEFD